MNNYKITAALFLLCILFSCNDKYNLDRTNTHDPKSKNFKAVVPVLTTTVYTALTINSATTGGNVTYDGGAAVTARGVCWNTATNPTTANSKTSDGSGTGIFASNITGLNANTTYYVLAYATNSAGTGYGSNVVSFKTLTSVPVLTTTTPTSIGLISAISGGNITSDGGAAVSARGVCWSTSANPTIALTTKTSDSLGIGTFTSKLSGLTAGATYHVRAYATNSIGTGYGLDLTFTTLTVAVVPALTTTAASAIALTTAISGGTVTFDGGANVTDRGVCWSTAPTPTIALTTKTSDGTGTGTFSSNLTGLTAGTKYYVRAYATNSVGAGYGTEISFTTNTGAVVPTITTTTISNITINAATSGGNIVSDGGAAVTARGVCWSATANPTTANSKTTDGTGIGIFTSSITGLSLSTTYHVRAYATNSAGTAYGTDISFTTSATAVVSTLSTTSVTSITSTSAISGGNITSDGGASVTARGVCWSTTSNPTIALTTKTSDGTGTGSFNSNITGLIIGTTYHVRAYATNSAGTAYGTDISFSTTAAGIPAITTTAVTANVGTTATSGGNITSDGGAAVTARGVCWSTTSDPTTALTTKTSDGTGNGSFTSSITGLTGGTTYHLRAYATNSAGTAYGADISFSTPVIIPTITTTAATAIVGTSATSGGNITSDGGAAVTARGVCWSLALNPTTADSKTSDGTDTGIFISSITGLSLSTTYHVRAYAINSAGTAYGADISFTTTATVGVPILSTTALTAITSTSAISGGNITSDGGAAVTVRGVCWSTTSNPTIALTTKTSDGTGNGSFTSNITDLLPGTTYHVRAYATNSAGTAYGTDISFSTIGDIPTITTTAVTDNVGTTATSGGSITSDGGASVTARGVCWGSALNPTISDSKTSDGTGSGSFVSNLTGLTIGTSYHLRAYATNSAGTAYGQDITFSTPNIPTITTTAITSITPTSASGGGNVTLDGGATVTDRGICWSTASDPTIALSSKTTNGSGTGTFTSSITGLNVSTTYYVRAYATNSAGTAYGANISFSTSAPDIPTITTTAVTANVGITATSGGNITSDGGAAVTVRGVCWGPALNPTTTDSKTSDGTGSGNFVSSLTGLTIGTSYHVRAYATNSAGTAYGQDIAFTTSNIPTITTTAITSITQTSASSGGNITLNGGASVTDRGVCWSTTSNPTIILTTKTSDGTGSGSFISNITGLIVSTTYYVRAYATNSAGTAYGANISFVTSGPVIPSLTTSDVSAVTLTTATSGGNVTADGFAAITARGVCWGTSANPTVALVSKTTDGTGTGTFSSSITSLVANTTYYLRAYATNSAGTGYGTEVIFKTAHSTLIDIEGNVYYAIAIGTQIWMRENLKTTKYRDGNNIANVTDNTAWTALTTGAYCWYNNDAATNKNTYGALYNWYTITDSRVLCPTGWHMPTDAEWTTLTTYLGGAGGKLKETGTTHWATPNTGATNETGFTALPGGIRAFDGTFSSIGNSGFWWSSIESDASNAWYRYLYYGSSSVVRSSTYKRNGYSVRCVAGIL